MTYVPHRPWLEHQAREFEVSKDLEYRALWWEMRCMKTQPIIDTFYHNYDLGRVTAMLVVAYPSGARLVWIDELRSSVSPERLAATRYLAWRRKMRWVKERNRWVMKGPHAGRMEEMLAHRGPVVLSINCEALRTDVVYRYLQRFMASHRVLVVADEDFAKGWTLQTQRLLWLGHHRNAVMRRWVSGTPVTEEPGDVFYPSEFLKPGLLGFTSKVVFNSATRREERISGKTLFADRYTETEEGQRFRGINPVTHEAEYDSFPVFVGWKNLDELRGKLFSFGSRVLRRDLSDAPGPVYQTRYFDLTKLQRGVYDRLRDRYEIELRQVGMRTLDNVLNRMVKLQMVGRNYYPPEDVGEPCPRCVGHDPDCDRCEGLGTVVRRTDLERIDPECNPAVDALLDEVGRGRRPAIVWCAFRQDVRDVVEALGSTYRVGAYYGDQPESVNEEAYRDFRSGALDVIVGTVQSGLSRSKDCSNAMSMVYYSNSFSGGHREQSVARAEHLLKTSATDVIDLVAEDTRDGEAVAALRAKKSLAAAIVGDPPG